MDQKHFLHMHMRIYVGIWQTMGTSGPMPNYIQPWQNSVKTRFPCQKVCESVKERLDQ